MHSPLSLRNTVPPEAPGGHGEKAQWPLSSTVFPCGQMHAPMSISPSRQGGGALHVPSELSAWPGGQMAATQLPWGSRTSFSPQVGGDEAAGAGSADVEAEAAAAGAVDADDATAAEGASLIAAGRAGAGAQAMARPTTHGTIASSDTTRRGNMADRFAPGLGACAA
jgi:hypothetical protein